MNNLKSQLTNLFPAIAISQEKQKRAYQDKAIKTYKNLFAIAETAKRYGSYVTANAAFAILFEYSLEDSSMRYGIESDNTLYCQEQVAKGNYDFSDEEHWYDLAVLFFDGCYLCIPFPLLSLPTKRVFSRFATSFLPKKLHDRKFKKVIDERSLEARIDILQKQLLAIASRKDIEKAAREVLAQSCRTCPSFAGIAGTHCVIHPYGKDFYQCPDAIFFYNDSRKAFNTL